MIQDENYEDSLIKAIAEIEGEQWINLVEDPNYEEETSESSDVICQPAFSVSDLVEIKSKGLYCAVTAVVGEKTTVREPDGTVSEWNPTDLRLVSKSNNNTSCKESEDITREISEAVHQARQVYKQGWAVLREIIKERPRVLRDLTLEEAKLNRQLPEMIAMYMMSNPDATESWLPSALMAQVQERLQIKKDAASARESAISVLDNYKKATWKTVRDASKKNPVALQEALLMAKTSAKGKLTAKIRFCESFADLLYDYIQRTGDESDLEWVLFAEDVKARLSFPATKQKAEPTVQEVVQEDKTANKSILDNLLPERTPEQKRFDELLDKVRSTAVVNMLTWESIECATQRDAACLERLIAACTTERQIDFVASFPEKLAKYMISLRESARIDWIPEDLLVKAENIIENQLEREGFKVGDRITSIDPDSREFGELCEVTSIENGWLIVRSNERSCRIHVTEAKAYIESSCNLAVGNYVLLPNSNDYGIVENISSFGINYLVTVFTGRNYSIGTAETFTQVTSEDVSAEIKEALNQTDEVEIKAEESTAA